MVWLLWNLFPPLLQLPPPRVAPAVPLASSRTVGCVWSAPSGGSSCVIGGAQLACLLTVSRACHILDAMDFKSSGSGWLSLYVTKESLDSWRVSDLITTVESPTLARYILSFLMMLTVAVVPAVLGFQVVSIKEWRKIHSY